MLTHIKLLLTALFWGGTFIAGRIISQKIDPYSAAFLRFCIAVVFLFAVLRIMKQPLSFKKKYILPVFLLGLTGVFCYNIFFFKGLYFINAGRAALIIATNPVFISLFSAILFKEKLTLIKILGIILSVSGAIVVITGGNFRLLSEPLGRGDIFIFICVLCWVSYSLIGKKVLEGLTPLVAVSYSTLVGVILLSVPAFSHGVVFSLSKLGPAGWAGLFYLGFFGTVLGFIWYYQGIFKIGPVKSGLYINFVPVSSILLGYLLLNETVTASLLAGAVLVIAGVFLTNLKIKIGG
ncbi:DMT family transporter [candidate division KSB1 bacterium]|nr:DMT family transporter [candidate division KSB1 bacterium]